MLSFFSFSINFQPNVEDGGDEVGAFFNMLGSGSEDCRYYTIDSFNDKFTGNSTLKLSIITINIRSFRRNCDEFIWFLNNLNIKFDIIILTETWLYETNTDLCNINGYKSVHSMRQERMGGGVSIFVHESLSFQSPNNLCKCN